MIMFMAKSFYDDGANRHVNICTGFTADYFLLFICYEYNVLNIRSYLQDKKPQ